MKATHYLEVFNDTAKGEDTIIHTSLTKAKPAIQIAENLATAFAKSFKDPVIYRDDEADGQSSENSIQIDVWKTSKNEDELDENAHTIIIKERN